MDKIWNELRAHWNVEALAQWAAATAPKVLAALVSFLAIFLLWKLAERLMKAMLTKVDLTARRFIHTVTRAIFLTIALVSVLSELGINTASLLASLGVVGLTIGFAAKDAMSNLISGIFIFWDRPFVLGDLVEIGGTYGRVEDITMRSTRVVTPDGRMLAIPNSTVVNSIVASYTNFPHLRLDIPMTVGLGEDYVKVSEILLEVARAHPESMPEPAPIVTFEVVGDFNVQLVLRVWIKDEKKHLQVRPDLRRRMYEALRQQKVDMPFETIQLAPFETRTTKLAG
jgi:small conductance mechanosensitive channel